MSFGVILKKLRESRGLTQQQLAEILNVGRPTIAGYETRDKQPDYNKLRCLSRFFNVSIDYMLGLDNLNEVTSDLDDELKKKSETVNQIDKLTDEELKILELFRQLNEKEKIKIEGMLEMKVSEANDLKRGMSSNYPSGEEAATIFVKDLA